MAFQTYIDKILDVSIEYFRKNKNLDIFPYIASYILPLLPQCKPLAYKEELEYRFTMFELNPINIDGRKIKILQDNERGYDLRPNKKEDSQFINPVPIIKSELFNKDKIVKIGIGPACNKEKTKYILTEETCQEKCV